MIRQPDGFVYKQEWWTTWLVERPFHDVRGFLEYIRRNIDEIYDRKPGEMWTFAGKSNVWGAASRSPREQFLELQEKLGENTVLFPNESPEGLDTAHIRAGLELFSYGYAEEPELISAWLEALNWAEIQRVHETADPELSPVALVFADLADKNQTMFSPAFLRKGVLPAAAQTGGGLALARGQGDLSLRRQSVAACWTTSRRPGSTASTRWNHSRGCTPATFGSRYPDWMLMGGIDASQLLPFGSEEEVREAVRRTIREAGSAGRLWLGSSTEIHPGIPRAERARDVGRDGTVRVLRFV